MAPKPELIRSVGLKRISTDEIIPNPHNPRMIFDPESLGILRESIRKVGILVPLSVYERSSDRKFVILDGERRWRCAKDLKLDIVPANIVAEPDTITNILTMFNIHNVREPWDITPTALKLDAVMKLTGIKNTKELAEMTGLKPVRVDDIKKLLQFERKYLDMTIIGDKDERISGDFFIQLAPVLKKIRKEYPLIYRKYGRDGIIERMIAKYRSKVIPAVLDFRYLLRTINSAKKGVSKESISRALERVIEDKQMPLRTTYEEIARTTYESEKLSKTILKLIDSLASFDERTIHHSPALQKHLRSLRKEIDRLLD